MRAWREVVMPIRGRTGGSVSLRPVFAPHDVERRAGGSLELVVGCMYSGQSEEPYRRVRRALIAVGAADLYEARWRAHHAVPGKPRPLAPWARMLERQH